MADKKINWSGKTKRDLQVYFSTHTKKGLSNNNYEIALEKYGENIIPGISTQYKNFDLRAVLARSAGIFGLIYILSVIIISLLGFQIKLFYIAAYLFLTGSAMLILILCEYNYLNIYKISRPLVSVTRHGAKARAAPESIVPGDLITLTKGDIVPADAKIIKSINLACSRRIRTQDGGYNIKTHALHGSRAYGFEADILYASDVIESGRCMAVVFATGADTRIAQSNNNKARAEKINKSGIQASAAQVSRTLFLISSALAVIMILWGIFAQRDLILVILTCLTASAAAFTEQLVILADLALSSGMKRAALSGVLIKDGADIDKLNKIDTLIAKKSDICPVERLRLDKIYFADEDFDVSYENRFDLGYIISNAAAVSDAYNPAVAAAFYEAADKLELDLRGNKKLGGINNAGGIISAPVSGNKNIVLVCLGEADNIIERCAFQLVGGELFEPVDIAGLERKLVEIYDRHDLVMAVALKELTGTEGGLDTEISGLDFWVFAAFAEINIPEVRADINNLKNFGITPVMIAESSGVYAYKTAVKFGVIDESENENYKNVLVDKANLINLVRGLNARGRYAAVTADNIDEAGILNEAYLSFGSGGMQVLKNKSGINLKNMSLKLILQAVKIGGAVYRNALNMLILSAGFFAAQYMLIIFASVLNGAYILNPGQIIWSSVGAGFFCSAAAAVNTGQVKRRRSINYKFIRKQGLLTGIFIFSAVILTYFICYALQADIFDYINSHDNIKYAQTSAFLACMTACFANAARFIKNIFTNIIYMLALSLNIILIYLALAFEPVREYLDFSMLDLKGAGVIAGVGLAQVIIFAVARKQ